MDESTTTDGQQREAAALAADVTDVVDEFEFSPLTPAERDLAEENVLILGAMGCRPL
jgi:hypothetical protein